MFRCCALWVGAVDDLWLLGKPIGRGGPWYNTTVNAGQPSDPYLMTGYDKKTLILSHTSAQPVTVHVEIDISGSESWQRYRSFDVAVGQPVQYAFPEAFQAYWVRLVSNQPTVATAQFIYE